jgi:peptide/nickel transport system substrate-binding protein
MPDDSARELAMLKGEVAALNGLHDQAWLKHMTSKGIILAAVGPPDLKALYFNLKMKPFDDKRVREAFAYGIGQKAIVDMQGEAISNYCTSPVPSGMHGHVDAGWGKYKRDPAKAKKLLAEAGYPNGVKVKLIMSKGHWYLDKMVIYQNLLKEVGIDLEMTIVDHTAYLTKIRSGTNPLAIYGTTQPLATYWLRNFYHTNSIVGTPTGMQNFMHYSNPEVDKLIELAETSFDEKVRLDALAKTQKIIVEDLPSIPVVETLVPCLRNPWLDLGYKPISGFNWTLPVGLKTKVLKK